MAVSTLPSQNLFQRANDTPNMRLESERLNSFRDWPCGFISPMALAKAGFYYTHIEDVVRCAYCSIEISKWEPGDNVVNDHRRWSPNCIFLQDLTPGGGVGVDVCGPYEIKPNSLAEGGSDDAVLNGLKKLAILTQLPAFPEMAIFDARLKTFKDWPKAMKQKPEEMADAGFFYTGRGDQTMCFQCGGGLNGWEKDDIPWEQHALWFPRCNFLHLKKSRDYIEQIINNNNRSNGNDAKTKQIENKITTTTTSCNEETKEIDDNNVINHQFVCKICYGVKDKPVLFIPCGHMVSCTDCAPALNKCPICRTALDGAVPVHLA